MDTGPLVAEQVCLLNGISFQCSSSVLSILLKFPIELSEFYGRGSVGAVGGGGVACHISMS